MATDTARFEKRLRQIDKKHRKMSNGRKTVIDRSGLVQELPARQFKVPLNGIVLALGLFFVFKGWLMHALGAGDFAARLEALAAGTTIEQLGAVVMRPDPASLWVAEMLARFF